MHTYIHTVILIERQGEEKLWLMDVIFHHHPFPLSALPFKLVLHLTSETHILLHFLGSFIYLQPACPIQGRWSLSQHKKRWWIIETQRNMPEDLRLSVGLNWRPSCLCYPNNPLFYYFYLSLLLQYKHVFVCSCMQCTVVMWHASAYFFACVHLLHVYFC